MPDLVGKFDFSGIPAATADQRPDFSGIAQAQPSQVGPLGYSAGDLAETTVGAAKGLMRTLVGLGRMFNPSGIPGDAESALGLDAANPGQQMGMTMERGAEFFVPGGAPQRAAATIAGHLPMLGRLAPTVARAGAEAIPSAVITNAQGGNPAVGAGVSAALSAVPSAVRGAAQYVGSKAEPLVRSAVKPTVTAMKQAAGAAYTGIEAQAQRLTRFILDNGITSAAKAEQIIKDSEKTLRAMLDEGGPITDAPQRAMRYLATLERSAARQALPAEDVATIRSAAQEMLEESGLGTTQTRTVMKDSPSGLVDPAGKPVQVPVQEKFRTLRDDVTAKEALEKARANSSWDTKRQWGERKGAKMEASKTIERAERDSVKEAVPEAKPVLQRQGQAIKTKEVMDRMEFRQGNRDAVGLPAHVMAAGEIAAGKVPILAFASNWLRNNQLKAGVWANRLNTAIQRGDEETARVILSRLGVAPAAEATSAR